MKWHTVTVVPSLPEKLKPLQGLAKNLWYTWNPDVIELWRRLDRDLWEESNHNPVRMLSSMSQQKLEEAGRNESFLLHMDRVLEALDQYMNVKTPYSFHLEKGLDPGFLVAYFSMEVGMTEALPIYSGGLGVLSGDHLKSASNLNLPLVGVSLLYKQGYFGQYLNEEGWQQEYYAVNDFENMPVRQETDAEGNPVEFTLVMQDRTVRVNLYRVQVGRIALFLLNTNLPENSPEDREITAQLYGGDQDMRFRQEILLGVGGVHALEALGLEPTVFHMNEGHSAFSGLERMRRLIKKGGLSLEAAKEVVKSNSVFTTHTPVPAGNDYFPPDLMGKYFGKYAEDLGLSFEECLALGRLNPGNNQEAFCMTMLAIRLSNYRNGVSKLHEEVSRGMWKGIWPAFPERDVPIVSVTNGVHIPSYISQEMADLYNRYLGPRWIEDPDNQKVWERVDLIPDTELWRTHERRRERLIAFSRRRVKEQLLRRGELPSEIKRAEDVLNPEALTICFARRFATYKRGDLLFRDAKRLAGILNDPERPVQIIFAGKAHPQDMAGKAIIKNIVQYIHEETFRYRVVFLEDYDINIARYMVQGADVWLNTPRRPMEACGTSGMKAVANGALHMSILDGWWAEGYSAGAGWAIGAGEEYEDTEYQDEIESRAMYELLEREVIPAFYARTRDGTPRDWIRMMKASMRRLCPIFNTHRMLEDYVDGFYVPAAVLHQKMQRERNQTAESFAEWKQKVQRHWKEVRIQEVKLEEGRAEIPVGKAMPIQARIGLGQLEPADVSVDLYYGPMDPDGDLVRALTESMSTDSASGEDGHVYRATVPFKESGKFGFMLRIMPKHPLLVHSADMGLVVWG
jgi:starch phosphorylase